jgi:hypothetical protein
MQRTGAHAYFEFASDFVLCFGFQLCFLFSVLVSNAPLCIALPVAVTRQFASC